jgi:hypothetical protein
VVFCFLGCDLEGVTKQKGYIVRLCLFGMAEKNLGERLGMLPACVIEPKIYSSYGAVAKVSTSAQLTSKLFFEVGPGRFQKSLCSAEYSKDPHFNYKVSEIHL